MATHWIQFITKIPRDCVDSGIIVNGNPQDRFLVEADEMHLISLKPKPHNAV
jgi:hypothetical protein